MAEFLGGGTRYAICFRRDGETDGEELMSSMLPRQRRTLSSFFRYGQTSVVGAYLGSLNTTGRGVEVDARNSSENKMLSTEKN